MVWHISKKSEMDGIWIGHEVPAGYQYCELSAKRHVASAITNCSLRYFGDYRNGIALLSGITGSQELWLKRLINEVHVIGLTDPIKEHTIKLRSLKLPDAIVCATAINEQAVLLTNDKKIHELDGLECRALEVRV